MARQYDPITSFTAGEISPQLRGRVDIDAYRSSAQTMRNFQPLQYGGARRRFGTEYVRDLGPEGAVARLIPFVISGTQGSIVALCNSVIRVVPSSDGTGPGYAGVPQWTGTFPNFVNVMEVDYAQVGQMLVLVHPSMSPMALTRVSDTEFMWRILPLAEPPTISGPVFLAQPAQFTYTESGATGTITLLSGTFRPSDVGRFLSRGTASMYITSLASSSVANVNFQSPISGTSGDLWISGTPDVSLNVGVSPAGSLMSVSMGSGVPNAVDVPETPFRFQDVGSYIFARGGVFEITLNSTGTVLEPDGYHGTIQVRVVRQADPGTANPTKAFRVERRLFGAARSGTGYIPAEYNNGYPGTVTFNDQRMVLSGFPGRPRMFVGSVAGDVLDFTNTGDVGDGYNWAADGSGKIRHVASGNHLLLFGEDGEYQAEGQDYGPITTDIPRIRLQTTEGIGGVQPVKVDRDFVFVQRSGKKVVSIGYDVSIQGYETSDLTLLAEHITGPGIVDVAYQRRPVPTLYCVRADGKMACLTLDRTQRVTAWWLWDTGFSTGIESVAVIPSLTEDVLWLSAWRGVGGLPRTLERVQTHYTGLAANNLPGIGYYLDKARIVDRYPDVTAAPYEITTHLPNQSVQVTADGVYVGAFTADGDGKITISAPGRFVLYGLSYSAELTPMPPEIPSSAGAGLGHSAQAVSVTVKVHQSYGGLINGAPITVPDQNGIPQDRLLAAEANGVKLTALLYSTDVAVQGLQGWKQAEPLVSITQNEPLPLHVLAVTARQGASGG